MATHRGAGCSSAPQVALDTKAEVGEGAAQNGPATWGLQQGVTHFTTLLCAAHHYLIKCISRSCCAHDNTDTSTTLRNSRTGKRQPAEDAQGRRGREGVKTPAATLCACSVSEAGLP